jgi:hypothetical protein
MKNTVRRRLIETAERFVDGEASSAELQSVWHRLPGSQYHRAMPLTATLGRALAVAREDALEGAARTAEMESAAQAALLRHIAGNPFHPRPRPAFLPTLILELANAAYAGEMGAVPPLYDALLEHGDLALAEHFRDASEHPRGCWALDAILGRE